MTFDPIPVSAPATIPAVVFLAASGASEAERWMAHARLAAASDLIDRLPRAGFTPVFAIVQDDSEAQALRSRGAEILEGAPRPFHFGRALAWVAERCGAESLAYFGAASAPLAGPRALQEWTARSLALPQGGALVNNVHSTDWAILRDTEALRAAAADLETDNALGWILREKLAIPVAVPPASAASLADIDTPGDLALMRDHPDLGPELRRALVTFPEGLSRRADGISRLLRTPAESLALIGRVSADVWLDLTRRTQLWVRVFAEERGMRASGRQARGEVQSLVGDMLNDLGPARFVARLAAVVGGALWDTRVWMAQGGRWPSEADRMAADLGWVDQITDDDARGLTEAIVEAGLPIVTGGHGVVAGSLLALLESLGD